MFAHNYIKILLLIKNIKLIIAIHCLNINESN